MPPLTLRLRQAEQKIFQKLPDALRDGWNVESETLTSEERPEELRMRREITSFDDPKLQKIIDAARTAKTPEEFERTAKSLDLTTLPQDDAAELFFVLGTALMGVIVTHLLTAATKDEDLEGIAALTEIRHLLLETNLVTT